MSRGKSNSYSSETGTPKAAVERLSLYLRELEALLESGQKTISSHQLGQALKITDAQVRKDLAYFGQFGYPGIGYRVEELRESLRAVLGTDKVWPTALVGAGNLGRALLGYRGFAGRGFQVTAVFDGDAEMVGKKVLGHEIHPMEDLSRIADEKGLVLAILAVPAAAAEEVASKVVQAGIVGILNFAPTQLKVPDEVSVISVDMALRLEQLAFQVNQRRGHVASPSESKDE
ncbi:Redox-sensing transcriptional repressor Rex [Planctomycetes bacterium Pan216]|uniref:Redox-sensing transcriptional repressor Rex n=1 Tax=Kolteria novifilia TaxID=2527975 RepID=A0A518AZ21_9BACT|nr:Redox-sensing transcriptional repressor Rex [Planctomycetes bacterium Pan216]